MRTFFLLAAAICLHACGHRYHSTYQIEGTAGDMTPVTAEHVVRARTNQAAASQAAGKYDRPLRLLQAPQPVMSRADTDAAVVGHVLVDIQFDEQGAVESTRIVQSTKESLAEAVVQAVRNWRIEPPLRDGKPVRMRVMQPFGFKTQQ